MLLDVGVSSTKITEEDCEDPSDAFLSYIDDNYDELDNGIDDFIDDNLNDTNLNCNADVSKIAINDILQEMRLHSPIENDFLSDLFGDEPSNIFCQIGNNDPKVNEDYYNNNFNHNYAFQDHNAGASDNNILDSLLADVSYDTPDVQMEFNDGVQFQYDVMDQFNGEPDITLQYPEQDITLPYPEPDSTTLSTEDTSGLTFDFNAIDNNNGNNEVNYNREPVPNGGNTVSDNWYFPCSTNLPMTPEELQQDIQNYLNTEQDYSYASFYEYADMINGTSDAQPDNTQDFPHSSNLLKEYIYEQNQLMQTPDPINPINSFETPNFPAPEAHQSVIIYQCTDCTFFTHSYHELCEHKRVHAPEPLIICTQCEFATSKPYEMRKHQAYGHRNEYATHFDPRIGPHMRDEH